MTSLGKDWHRPCLRCERCGKTLTPGGHAEVRGACTGTLRGARLGRGQARRRSLEGPALAVWAAPWWPKWRLAAGAQRPGGTALRAPPHSSPLGEWTGQGFGSLRALREGGRRVDKEEATRGSGGRGVCGPPPHPHPAPSMMASLTATSPATEYSLDPRVSVARSGGNQGPLPPPRTSTPPFWPVSAGVNTGAVGSYIYDRDPEGKVQP